MVSGQVFLLDAGALEKLGWPQVGAGELPLQQEPLDAPICSALLDGAQKLAVRIVAQDPTHCN